MIDARIQLYDARQLRAFADFLNTAAGIAEEICKEQAARYPSAPFAAPSVHEELAPLQEAVAATAEPGEPAAPTSMAAAVASTPAVGATSTPPAPPLGPGAAPVSVVLDKSGLPWDGRINTDNRNQTQKGIWKRKPGIEDEVYAAVLAELKATMGAPAVAAPPAPPVPPTPAAAAPTTMAPPPPSATAAAASVPSAPVQPAAPTMAFLPFIQAVTAKIQEGKITADEVNGVCLAHGVASLTSMGARLDLIPAVFAALEAMWATRA